MRRHQCASFSFLAVYNFIKKKKNYVFRIYSLNFSYFELFFLIIRCYEKNEESIFFCKKFLFDRDLSR